MIFILSYDIILDFNSNGQKKVFKSKYKSKELNMAIYRDLEGQTESGPFLKMEPEAKSRETGVTLHESSCGGVTVDALCSPNSEL